MFLTYYQCLTATVLSLSLAMPFATDFGVGFDHQICEPSPGQINLNIADLGRVRVQYATYGGAAMTATR